VHPLDNAVWHALTGPQAAWAETAGSGAAAARRFPRDVSPFTGIPDEPDPGAWPALAQLVGAGPAVLFRDHVDPPPDWSVAGGGTGWQMVAAGALAPVDADRTGLALRDLTAADAGLMVDLVGRTRPGPFEARTVELGGYQGLFDGEALVAMAGRRLHVPGHVEISAVCTDAAYRRRGLAALLTREVAERIAAEGDTPVLHVAATNEGARRVYERLGFTVRREVHFVALVPAGAGGAAGDVGLPPPPHGATSTAS
jgi:ribosomal protein S18 acetylase RimI-like enzyme